MKKVRKRLLELTGWFRVPLYEEEVTCKVGISEADQIEMLQKEVKALKARIVETARECAECSMNPI